MPYLAFNLNDGNEFVFDVLEDRLAIGRDGKNDIVIDNSFISGFHAEFLKLPDGGYELVDLRSSNGTFVNGKRIERSRVKGGDRIMFGQLESRFRERAPKGLAPVGSSKAVATSKNEPPRIDGRRGDTEGVPARDKDEPPPPSPDTGKIEPTKPVVHRVSTADAPKSPPAPQPPAPLIPKPDPAAARQAADLREEIEKLRQQRDALKIEAEIEQRRRDDLHSLEATLEARQKELAEAQAALSRTHTETASLRAEADAAKADAAKFDQKRRDLGNLESKLDSTRTLVTKTEADLATARKALENVHAAAESRRASDTAAAEQKLASLQQDISAAEKRLAEITNLKADAEKSEAGLHSKRSAELQALEATLATCRADESSAKAKVEQLSTQLQTLEKSLNQKSADESSAIQKLSKLTTDISAAEKRLAEITNLKADAEKSEAGLHSKRSAELQALEATLATKKAELDRLTTESASKTADAEAAETKLIQLTGQSKAIESTLSTNMAEAAAASRTLSKLVADISAAEQRAAELKELEANLAAKQAGLAILDEKAATSEAKLRQLTAQAQALETRLPALGAAEEKLTRLTAEISVAEARVKELAQRRNEAEKSEAALKARFTTELQAIEKDLLAKQTESKRLAGQIAAQAAEASAAEAEVKHLTEQTKNLQTRLLELQNAEQKLAALAKDITAGEARLSDLSKHNSELQFIEKDLTAKKAELSKLTEQLTLAHADESSAKTQVQKLSSDLKTLEATLSQRTADESSARQKLTQLTSEIKAGEVRLAELAKLKAEGEKSEDELKSKRSAEIQKLEQDLTKLANDLEAKNAALHKAQEQLLDAQQRLAQAGGEETALKARVEALRGNESRLAELTRQLGRIQDERGAVEAGIAELLATRAAHQKDVNTAAQHLNALRTEAGEITAKQQAAKAELERIIQERDAAQAGFDAKQKAAEAKLADIQRQTADAEAQAAAQQKKASAVRDELDLQIGLRTTRANDLAAQVRALEEKAAELENKLSDLASTDSRLKDAHEALKAVESHKAEIVTAVAALAKDRDERTRELLAATEHGRAQHLLGQELVKRREAIEKEIHALEDQQAAASVNLGRLREDIKKAEADLAERRSQMAKAEQQLQNARDLAATVETQFKVTQAEQKKLATQAATAKSELEELAASTAAKSSELAAAEATLEKHTQQHLTLVEKISGLEAIIATLTSTHASTQQSVAAAQSDYLNLQDNLAAKQKEMAAAEKRAAELAGQTAGLEDRLLELNQAGRQHAELSAAITAATQHRDKLASDLQRLTKERAELETLMPDLRGTVQQTRAQAQNLADELAALNKDKTAALEAMHAAVKERQEAESAAEALRAQSTSLEKLLGEKRATLDVEVKTKLAEAGAAETRLHGIQERIASGEARLKELADVNERLTAATRDLKDSEKIRAAEEKNIATLARQHEKLRADLATVETDFRAESAKLAELARMLKATETKAADAEGRLQKALAAQQAAEKARSEADTGLEKARAEEKALRKQIPALNSELAGIQAALSTFTKQRDEASQFVTRLNVTTDSQNKKLAGLQQQIEQLEEAHRVREQRVMKAQEDVDKEAANLKAAQEQTRAAEAALAEADKELKDMRAKVSATKKEAATLENELRTRLDRVQNLKADEERLARIVENQKLDLQGADSMLKELQSKIDSHQTRLGELIHSGGKMLGLGEAITHLEARQAEITRAIRAASEEELAIQVKLNAAQEALNRESARAEQARKDREAAEAEFNAFSGDIQRQAATLQNYELEQKKRIAELEKRINDHASAEALLITQIEQTKAALGRLEEQRGESARAEAQLKHWQEIEKRLRSQLGELEEKHEILRRGLGTEESTVIMFANDLIKRIDLIDALKERYASVNGGVDIAAQLTTLRQSFEDILFQHGVSEFEVAPGTEVGVDLRKRIAVVDSTPGKNKPRVVESCRTGFVYSRSEGHEVILRKVEVRTSSQ